MRPMFAIKTAAILKFIRRTVFGSRKLFLKTWRITVICRKPSTMALTAAITASMTTTQGKGI